MVSRSSRVPGRAVKHYWVYALVWLAVCVLSSFTYDRALDLKGTAAWAGLLHPVLFGLTAWPVLRKFVRGERWFTIPNAVLGLTYVCMGLGSVYFVFHYDSLSYQALRRPESVREALFVVLLGVVAYRGAARIPALSGVVRRLPKLPPTPSWTGGMRAGVFTAIATAVCVDLYLAGTGSLGYRTGTGGIANTGLWSLLIYLRNAGPIGLAGVYYYWFSGTRFSSADRFFIISATATLAALGLLSGMKQEFITICFAVLVPYTWTRTGRYNRTRKLRKEIAFGAGLIAVVLLLFAVNPLYRAALRNLRATEGRVEQGSAATAIVVRRLASDDFERSLLATGVENLWARLSIFPFHLAVIDQVPEIRSFRKFDRYAEMPAMMIVPRLLWPDKPMNTGGADFQREFISAQIVFSTTPSVFGWSYIEWGVAGVIILMVILGAFAGSAEVYLAEAQRGRLAALLLYTALFIEFAGIEADPFWLLGGIPKVLVPALVVYSLFVVPAMVIPSRRHASSVMTTRRPRTAAVEPRGSRPGTRGDMER